MVFPPPPPPTAVVDTHQAVVESFHYTTRLLQGCGSCCIYASTCFKRTTMANVSATIACYVLWVLLSSFIMTIGWESLYYDPHKNQNHNSNNASSLFRYHHQQHWYNTNKTRITKLLAFETFLCFTLLALGLVALHVLCKLWSKKSTQRRRWMHNDGHEPVVAAEDGDHDNISRQELLFYGHEEEDDDLGLHRPRSFSLVQLCGGINSFSDIPDNMVIVVDHSKWVWKRLTCRLVLAMFSWGIYYHSLIVLLEYVQDTRIGGSWGKHNSFTSSSEKAKDLTTSPTIVVVVMLIGIYPILLLIGVYVIRKTWISTRQGRPPRSSTHTSSIDDINDDSNYYSYVSGNDENSDMMMWVQEDSGNQQRRIAWAADDERKEMEDYRMTLI